MYVWLDILLDDLGHVCLTDFGLSRRIWTTPTSPTPSVVPPSTSHPKSSAGLGHNQAVDWWSLGHSAVRADSGYPSLLLHQRQRDVQQDPTWRALRFPPFLSDECKQVIIGLLNRDPHQATGGLVRGTWRISRRCRSSASMDFPALMKKRDRVARTSPTAIPLRRLGTSIPHSPMSRWWTQSLGGVCPDWQSLHSRRGRGWT